MLDVTGSKELQGTILALKQMDTVLRRRIFKATRQQLLPEWRQELNARAGTALEQRVIGNSSRVDVTAETVRLKAALSRKRMSGGATPEQIGHAVEFGGLWRRGRVDAVSNRGKRYSYTRTLNKQLRPRRRQGYVAWPAGIELVPRFASLWVSITIRTMYDAFERKLS